MNLLVHRAPCKADRYELAGDVGIYPVSNSIPAAAGKNCKGAGGSTNGGDGS